MLDKQRVELARLKIESLKEDVSYLEKIIDIYHEYLAGEFTSETKMKFADDVISIINKKEM